LGALRVYFVGAYATKRQFDLGVGFTEEERRILEHHGFFEEYIPGGPIKSELVHFKRGDWITVRYREMTKDGLPKEARHWRKFQVA
jgi:hypothetical protein